MSGWDGLACLRLAPISTHHNILIGRLPHSTCFQVFLLIFVHHEHCRGRCCVAQVLKCLHPQLSWTLQGDIFLAGVSRFGCDHSHPATRPLHWETFSAQPCSTPALSRQKQFRTLGLGLECTSDSGRMLSKSGTREKMAPGRKTGLFGPIHQTGVCGMPATIPGNVFGPVRTRQSH